MIEKKLLFITTVFEFSLTIIVGLGIIAMLLGIYASTTEQNFLIVTAAFFEVVGITLLLIGISSCIYLMYKGYINRSGKK